MRNWSTVKVEEEVFSCSSSSHSDSETLKDAVKETPAVSYQQIMLNSQRTEIAWGNPYYGYDDGLHASDDNDETDIDIIQTEFETDTENELGNDEGEALRNSSVTVETGISETRDSLDIHFMSVKESALSLCKKLPPLMQFDTTGIPAQTLQKPHE